jgi:hypothetical protein
MKNMAAAMVAAAGQRNASGGGYRVMYRKAISFSKINPSAAAL